MKNIIYTLVLILLGTGVLVAQSNFHNVHYLDPYNPEYVKGEVLIKFKDEVRVESSTRSGVAVTGITSVDVLLEPYQIETIDKVFKETREQRQRKTVRTIRDFTGNEIEVPALFNIYKLKFDTIWDAKQIIEELQKDENVEFAEPNYLVYTNEVMENGGLPNDLPKQMPLPANANRGTNTLPNDPLYSQQWYLPAINAPAAWDLVTGDTTQIIAIIDTGVDWDHPDLDDNIWTNWNEIPDNGIDDDNNGYIDDTRGWDYINNDNDPNDDNSHGTHVAGIAAAEGNNEIGICGVAWNAQIMPVKMLQSSGTGNSTDFASAIEYASDNGATVINMSLGSYGESQVVKTALENAYAGTGDGEGSILVAAAGNNGAKLLQEGLPPGNMFPACYSFVIGVQATNQYGSLAGFSNVDPSGPVEFWNQWGHNYEMKAPGVGIISCKPNGSYWSKNGTSMASPIVAATVSLMRQNDIMQSGEEIFAKLIQGTNSGIVDINNSLTIGELIPDLYYIKYTIVDTLPGCDGDGIADAGETIQLYITIKNGGGQADSVWTNIRFAPFEDTTVATINDSSSYIGDISTYATLSGLQDPFNIYINPFIANNRDIMFQYEIGAKDIIQTRQGLIKLSVTNGEELHGIYYGETILNPDKYYIVTDQVVFDTLVIKPGTQILINPEKKITVLNQLIANGKQDSLIYFLKNNSGYGGWYGINVLSSKPPNYSYCYFEHVAGRLFEPIADTISNSIITNCDATIDFHLLTNCNIINGNSSMTFSNQKSAKMNIFSNNNDPSFVINELSGYKNNISYNNTMQLVDGTLEYSVTFSMPWGIYKISPNYYGTSDSSKIENLLYDYFEHPNYPIVTGFDSALHQPPSECHGIVWKVEINNLSVNKYDNPYNSPTGLGVVSAETLKFDLYFNRSMDTAYTPLLTFGIREPYTQHIVVDSAAWSSDSTIWTAYKNIDMTTGDGIQKVRVTNARDNERFEIPIEDSRFEFVIQAAAAASIEFYATPGIGKVELEWPPTPTDDALGYNLYRSYNLTDSTYSDTLIINTELILDTVYTDYNVIPDTTYHYFYKTLGTDMVETDYSKRVTATPFDAANGDANGDLAVNVLDITTIVSYMLNQNPSPFLFDAADVNYDDEINVLDIIGLVQLINGKKSSTTQPLPEVSNNIAYYHLSGNKLSVESNGNVAALQFKLKVRSRESGVGSWKSDLDKLKIFSLENGFEFAYAVVDEEIIGIFYSLSGKQLPEGITQLFRFEGIDGTEVEITEIFGGDLNGDYVPVLKKGENASIIDTEARLQVNPNPFSYSTQIKYTIPENGIVNLRLFDLTGAEVEVLTNSYHHSGNHAINWSGTNSRGQKLKPGIYLLQLKVKSVSGNIYNKEVKIVLVK